MLLRSNVIVEIMELNQIVASNIVELRKERGWTQVQLADKLNYTDKAISKWERAESIPELVTLKALAELFGVTVDYLTSSKPKSEKKIYTLPKTIRMNRIIITAIATLCVFLVSTVAFVYSAIYLDQIVWMSFIWAVPASALLLSIFNYKWGKRKFWFYIWSTFLWTFLAAIYLQTMQYNTWLIFILGAPIQTILILFSFLRK